MAAPLSVFVYCDKSDEEWLNGLLVYVAPVIAEGEMTIASNLQLDAGATIDAGLAQLIAASRCHVLIVTPTLLASADPLLRASMATIVERHRAGTGRGFCIHARRSLFRRTPAADLIQLNAADRPLFEIEQTGREAAYDEIYSRFAEHAMAPDLSGRASAPSIVLQPPPASEVDTAALLRRIDRTVHEERIVGGAIGAADPSKSFLVVPGARVHDPEGFAERIRQDTARKIMRFTNGRPVRCIDLQWPTFDESGPDAEAGLRQLMHSLANALNRSAGEELPAVPTETAAQAAERAFRLLAAEATSFAPLIISALTDSTPAAAEIEVFSRFAALWQEYRGSPAEPRALVVFLAQFERDAFLAGFAPPEHVDVLNPLPFIVYNDIRNWAVDEGMRRHFDPEIIVGEADAAFAAEERLPMRTVKGQAAGWLAKARRART